MFSYVHKTIAKHRPRKLALTCGELRSTGGTSSRGKFQDKRTLCASALAATSGTAASCRPSVCLDFLNPCLTLSFFRQGYGGGFVALSLSLSLSVRMHVCLWSGGWLHMLVMESTGIFHCQACQAIRALMASLDTTLSERPCRSVWSTSQQRNQSNVLRTYAQKTSRTRSSCKTANQPSTRTGGM